MRVYFIGAHSTGKTTLARYVAERYGLPLLNEVARAVQAEKELSISTIRANLSAADSFQEAVFRRQVQEEAGKESFVSDRSFDNLAYAAQHSRILGSLFGKKDVELYVAGLRRPDAVLFYVRPSRSLMSNDGVRESVDWDEMVRVDGMVKFMLEMWGLRYFSVWPPSMQERARFVDSVLELVAGDKWQGSPSPQ